MSARLYFQYQPDEESRGRLTELQTYLAERYGVGVAVDPAEFHMTVFHVGDTAVIDAQLRQDARRRPTWTYDGDAFREWLPKLTRTMLQHMPPEIDVTVTGYESFKTGPYDLAAAVVAPQEISQTRELGFRTMRQCLLGSGVPGDHHLLTPSWENHEPFMAARPFQPHIMLYKHIHQAVGVKDVRLQDTLHLELVPPSYDLKHGRYT